MKQKILIPYSTPKQLLYVNTKCLLTFCFISTSYIASIRVTLFWDAFVLCEEGTFYISLGVILEVIQSNPTFSLPKFSHRFNYSAVQIPCEGEKGFEYKLEIDTWNWNMYVYSITFLPVSWENDGLSSVGMFANLKWLALLANWN